jgi:hypothetical protein
VEQRAGSAGWLAGRQVELVAREATGGS